MADAVPVASRTVRPYTLRTGSPRFTTMGKFTGPRTVSPCAGTAVEQQGTQVEQKPAEQQALQQEAASQAQGLSDEARMKQQV